MKDVDTMLDVLSIGSALVDIFVGSKEARVVADDASDSGESLTLPLGAKVAVETLCHELGGGGANTSVLFGRLGLAVGVIARVGHDPLGVHVGEVLLSEGVATAHIVIDEHADTGQSVVLMAPNGNRTVLAYRGAGGLFLAKEILESVIAQTKWVYLSSIGGDRQTLTRIFALCHLHKVKVAWNPGNLELAHGISVLTPLLQQTDVLLLNREEAAELTGLPHHKTDAILTRLLQLLSHGVVVITDGSRGAMAFDGLGVELLPGREVSVVDATGAGDAFGSGFVGALIAQMPVKAALQFGMRNAESVIGHLGAQPGLLTKNDLLSGRLTDLQ